MHVEASVTSVSWTPGEAATRLPAFPFGLRAPHHDDVPPPDRIDDLDSLRGAQQFCGANELRAWIEVDNGAVVDSGYAGGGRMGEAPFDPGESAVAVPSVGLPDLQQEPEVGPDSVRFVQTAGGYAGFPALRRGRGRNLVQVVSPVFWTTLALTLHADGSSKHEVVGSSAFPRHWIYDDSGALVEKTAQVDVDAAYRASAEEHTPWGDENSPALMTHAESAVERALGAEISAAEWMPRPWKLKQGETLMQQGEAAHESTPLVFLVLDGVLGIEVDGAPVAELGPGAVLGERALFEGGVRTATVTALTKSKVLPVPTGDVSRDALAELAQSHQRKN